MKFSLQKSKNKIKQKHLVNNLSFTNEVPKKLKHNIQFTGATFSAANTGDINPDFNVPNLSALVDTTKDDFSDF